MHRKSNGRANGSKTLYTTHNAEPRMRGNIISRNYFENWRRQKRLSDWSMPSRPRFSIEINWKSRGSHEECCKVFLGKTIRHHLRIHDTTRKPLLEYYDSCLCQNTIQNMKNIQLCLDVFVLVLLVLIFTGPAKVCDVTMSHTWIYSWCKIKVVFFDFFIYFCSFRRFRLFRSFRWFRFARFARFVSLFRVLVNADQLCYMQLNIPKGAVLYSQLTTLSLLHLAACRNIRDLPSRLELLKT